jgi:hypothetical protein
VERLSPFELALLRAAVANTGEHAAGGAPLVEVTRPLPVAWACRARLPPRGDVAREDDAREAAVPGLSRWAADRPRGDRSGHRRRHPRAARSVRPALRRAQGRMTCTMATRWARSPSTTSRSTNTSRPSSATTGSRPTMATTAIPSSSATITSTATAGSRATTARNWKASSPPLRSWPPLDAQLRHRGLDGDPLEHGQAHHHLDGDPVGRRVGDDLAEHVEATTASGSTASTATTARSTTSTATAASPATMATSSTASSATASTSPPLAPGRHLHRW